MKIDYTNITLDVALQASRAYNNGCYARGIKNPDLDKRARALFAGGLASSEDGIREQVRFIGVDYGGVAGFKAARSLVPDIARDIHKVRDRYDTTAKSAPPLMQEVVQLDVVAELYAPFVKELHGKRNWLVWAAKFWHFLNPEAFPMLDSRVDGFFRTRGRSQSAEKYVCFCKRFRGFAISHRGWLPDLREADGGLAWRHNKLWDKVCYGIKELARNAG